jgi:hypothetical protein
MEAIARVISRERGRRCRKAVERSDGMAVVRCWVDGCQLGWSEAGFWPRTSPSPGVSSVDSGQWVRELSIELSEFCIRELIVVDGRMLAERIYTVPDVGF